MKITITRCAECPFAAHHYSFPHTYCDFFDRGPPRGDGRHTGIYPICFYEPPPFWCPLRHEPAMVELKEE